MKHLFFEFRKTPAGLVRLSVCHGAVIQAEDEFSASEARGLAAALTAFCDENFATENPEPAAPMQTPYVDQAGEMRLSGQPRQIEPLPAEIVSVLSVQELYQFNMGQMSLTRAQNLYRERTRK